MVSHGQLGGTSLGIQFGLHLIRQRVPKKRGLWETHISHVASGPHQKGVSKGPSLEARTGPPEQCQNATLTRLALFAGPGQAPAWGSIWGPSFLALKR